MNYIEVLGKIVYHFLKVWYVKLVKARPLLRIVTYSIGQGSIVVLCSIELLVDAP